MSEATRLLSRRSSLVILFVAFLTIYHLGNDLLRSPASLTSSSAFFSWSAVDKRPSSSTTNGESVNEDVPSGPAKDIKSLFDEFHATIAEQEKKGQKRSKPSSPAAAARPPPPSPPATKPTGAVPANAPAPAPAAQSKVSTASPLEPPPPSFNFTITEASDGCTNGTQPSEHAEALFSDYPTAIAMNNLVEIMQAGISPGDVEFTGRRIAMCKLRRYGNYAHFPHMMQQFARCFSFWQIYKSYEPYLYMYTHVHGSNTTHHNEDGFNRGMFRLLQEVFNVTVVYNFDDVDENTLLVKPLYDVSMEESLQQGIVFQNQRHAVAFREAVQQHYNVLSVAGCHVHKRDPVIRILNRRAVSKRTIVNLKKVQKYLQKLTTQPVKVVTFENRTFMEQMEKMSQTDILVSPHGAQLASLAFLPTCGAVFEVFPAGYYLPYFFGPYAATSGLQHGYVYNGIDVQKEWFEGNQNDRDNRIKARRTNVCVPLKASIALIGQMVDNWKVCCQERAAQGLVD